ncbi:MAG: hypothetical protein K2K14_09885 [Ruminococcus sp.]|nr:hypothetical protein [Ruminococcus sp.]
MDNKKIIMIDCNSVTSYGELPLLNYEVEYFGLKDGMEVIAYEGTDVWAETVHYNPSVDIHEQWWVELGNYVNTLTDEEYKWWVAGCRQGECTGERLKEIDIAKKLIDFGMEIKDIQKIVNLCEDQLYHIKCKKLFRKFEEKIISDGGMFKSRYVVY